MTDPPTGGSVFNIGSQHAHEIYQAAGDQTVYHAAGSSAADLLKAMSDLRAALASAAGDLSPPERREAEHLLGTVDAEFRRPEPDKEGAARALGGIARILRRAGKLANTLGTFQQLAAFLGVPGAGLIQLLG